MPNAAWRTGSVVAILTLVMLGAPAGGSVRAAAATDAGPPLHAAAMVRGSAVPGSARPRIGLVLGGGGARGLGHIGVLRVLEELRVPVDYISGTSMGAIIAGLYAAGLSPDEIETAMASIDWEDLASDLPRRGEQTFRRKQDRRSGVFGFELGLKGLRPTVASGLLAGQKMVVGIRVPELYTSLEQDFDSLPIPLRVVATDLATGEMIILRKGSLIYSLRASMSIPGLFSPVRIGDRLLIDGGVVRNVPIDVCEQMGAEVIIASDIGGNPPSMDQLSTSLLDVAGRALGLFIQSGYESMTERADVYLRLGLLDFGLVAFLDREEIIRRGEAVARSKIDSLARFSVSEEEYAAFQQRHRRPGTGVKRIVGVELDNQSRVDPRVIAERISLKPGDALDLERLDHDLARVYGLGMFELVDFQLMPRGDGDVLQVRAQEKRYAPNIVNLGLEVVDDLYGRITMGFLVRHTRLESNRLGGELRTDVRIGLTRGIASEWYQPLDRSRTVFLAPHAQIWHEVQDVYDGDHRIGEYGVQNLTAGLDAGLNLGSFGEVRTGLVRGRVDGVVLAGAMGLPTARRSRGIWRSRFEYDILDRTDFPTRGGTGQVRMTVARTALGDGLHYEKVSGEVTHFHSFGPHTFHAGLTAGSRLGAVLPADEEFVLGGPQSQFGLKPGQERGQAYGVARLGYYKPLHDKLKLVGLRFYVGGVLEAGRAWRSPGDATLESLRYSAAVLLGATSPIGPIQVGYGRSHLGDDTFFTTIGRQFGNVGR